MSTRCRLRAKFHYTDQTGPDRTESADLSERHVLAVCDQLPVSPLQLSTYVGIASRVFFHFIRLIFCSSNQQSQAVAIHTELDRKATKHRQLPRKLRTQDKIKTLRVTGLLKHIHSHDKGEKKTQNTHTRTRTKLPRRRFRHSVDRFNHNVLTAN